MHPILSAPISAEFQRQIEIFEKQTSCEIRIHIEEQNDAAVLDRAAFVFDHLSMHRTKQRNALLVYIQLYPAALAIIGDVGIHPHVAPAQWQNWKDLLARHFSQGDFASGIEQTLQAISAHLSPIFPWNENDINELSDQISR